MNWCQLWEIQRTLYRILQQIHCQIPILIKMIGIYNWHRTEAWVLAYLYISAYEYLYLLICLPPKSASTMMCWLECMKAIINSTLTAIGAWFVAIWYKLIVTGALHAVIHAQSSHLRYKCTRSWYLIIPEYTLTMNCWKIPPNLCFIGHLIFSSFPPFFLVMPSKSLRVQSHIPKTVTTQILNPFSWLPLCHKYVNCQL